MRRYCDGDRDAFRLLYDQVAPRLFAYLLSLVGDRAAADDLLQHTFIKLHRNRAAYVRGADPMPWLYTIAQRTFLDEVRRKDRDRVRLMGDESAPTPRAALDGVAEASRADDEIDPAQLGRVLDALTKLPPNQRQALELTKLRGMSVADAATEAGTTPGAIKLRAHRAYTALRRVLGVPVASRHED
jgi:RNA polymerase sigma-70 factor (ECF subfamily)